MKKLYNIPAPNTDAGLKILSAFYDPAKNDPAERDQAIELLWPQFMDLELEIAADVESPGFEKYVIAQNSRVLSRRWVKSQQENGWKLPNGEPIKNATAVFLAYCEAIGRRAAGNFETAGKVSEAERRNVEPVSTPQTAANSRFIQNKSMVRRTELEKELNAICDRQGFDFWLVRDFIEMNEKNGWCMPSGEPIKNPCAMFTNYCKKNKERQAERIKRLDGAFNR